MQGRRNARGLLAFEGKWMKEECTGFVREVKEGGMLSVCKGGGGRRNAGRWRKEECRRVGRNAEKRRKICCWKKSQGRRKS
jgi:hypothetical protein